MQRDDDTHDMDDTAKPGYWSKADGKYELRTPSTSKVYGEGWLPPADEVAEPKHQSTDPARQQVEEPPQNDAGTTIVFESSNITSGNTNWVRALARKAAVQFVQ